MGQLKEALLWMIMCYFVEDVRVIKLMMSFLVIVGSLNVKQGMMIVVKL